MSCLEETSAKALKGIGTYDTVPQHPKFSNYTPQSEQPQDFMRSILLQKTHAAKRDEARQQRHAKQTIGKFRAAEERKAAIAKLNPDVDRSPARRGVVDDSKLVIALFVPRKSGHRLREYRYQAPVDWSRAAITKLNQWRAGIFQEHLPNLNLNAGLAKYHEEEDQWLRDNVIGTRVAQGGWHTIPARFNSHFEGRVLAGQITPRPARTLRQLKNRRAILVAKAAIVNRQKAKHLDRATQSAIRNTRVYKHTRVDLPVEECD